MTLQINLLKSKKEHSKMKLSKVSTNPTKSCFETKENYIKVKIKMIKDHLTLQTYEVEQLPERRTICKE